jgi:hypothetical protein
MRGGFVSCVICETSTVLMLPANGVRSALGAFAAARTTSRRLYGPPSAPRVVCAFARFEAATFIRVR